MVRAPIILSGLAILAMAAPAQAAGPRLTSAGSSDRDGDGRVDTIELRFSAKVKGKGSFSVAGRTVTAVAKARGRRVELRLAEGQGCDLGLLPRVAYRSGLKTPRGRKVRPSRVDMERKDRRGPRLTCAVTADADGDGRVDGLMLTWSKRLRAAGAGGFTVAGFSVADVAAPGGRNLLLGLDEHDSPNSGATPAVSYVRVKAGGVRGSRGRQALSGGLTATRDGVAPVLASARTADSDSDGLIDSVFASFSEPVSAVPGGIDVEGGQVTGVTGNGGELALGIAEGPLGTGARPQLSYGTGELTDAAGNAAPAGSHTPDDGAGPVLETARSGDANGDGRLDSLVVTFSEPVSHPADSDGSYPLEAPGYGISAVGAANGPSVELALQQASDPDTGLKPGVRYVRGSGAPVLDGAGNEAVSSTLGGTEDGAAPRLLAATTFDTDEDGSLDRVRFRFSEAVVHTLGVGAFSAQGLTATAPAAADGSSVDVGLVEAASPNTGLQPVVSYVPTGPGNVTDVAGNLAPTGGVVAADGAGPVMVEGSTADTDSDQRIDRVTVTMSEPVTYPGDSAAPFSLATAGYQVAAIGAASGNSFAIDLVEPGQPDTGGAPDVTYTAGGSLRDLAGVEAVARTYTGRTRDTLAPSFVAAETADADGNGRLDRIDLRYSEDVQGGASAAPFSVTGRTVTGVEFSGPRARIVIAEGPAGDTADRPPAGYTPPAQASDRVRDLPKGPGDTPEDAPAQSPVQPDDRARPAIVQALTGDALGTPDGRIDRVALTFSEPVTHAAEAAGPFSIALGAPHAVSAVSEATGDSITVQTDPQLNPDGGSKPTVTVIDTTKILDAVGNQAFGGDFSATQDGVRPVIVAARLGERDAGGACATSPPQNSIIDCMTVTWSEDVTHADDPSLVVGGFTIEAPVPAVTNVPVTDIPLVEGASPNRESSGSVTYTAPAAVPVVDAAGLEALSTTPSVVAGSACQDDLNEPNDSRLVDSPLVGDTFGAVLCAADEDWFRVQPDSNDQLHVMMNPENGAILRLELWDAAGGSALRQVTADAAGDPVVIDEAGPLLDTYYWLRIVGTDPDVEGQYCSDTTFEPGESCTGGGGDPL